MDLKMSDNLPYEIIEFITNILYGNTDVQAVIDESTWGVAEIGPFKLKDYSVKNEDGKDCWDEDKLEAACEIYIDEIRQNYDLIGLFDCFIDTHNHSQYCLLEDKKNKNGYVVLYDTEFFYRADFVESLDKNLVSKKLIEVLLDGPNECLYTDIWLNPDYLPRKDFLEILPDEKTGWPTEYPPVEKWIEKYYEN